MSPLPDLYQHDTRKFTNLGLQLRLPVDMVPPGQYSRFTNASTRQAEGTLQGRHGAAAYGFTGLVQPLHTIKRLNQPVTSIVGELLTGIGTHLFNSPYPAPGMAGTFGELSGLVFSGNRLSIVSFRFDADQAAWAIIGDINGMRKRRGGTGLPTSGLYQQLGITPPSVAATAAAGGAGLLNSTGGTAYDWVYTYLNGVTLTESNPSPINYASTDVKRPTASTNPDPGFSSVVIQTDPGWSNPGSAFDNNPATFASGATTAATQVRQSCQWNTWSAFSGTPGLLPLTLNIDCEVDTTGSTGTCFAAFYYSLDAGATWKTLFTTSVAVGRQTFQATMPSGTLATNLQVRAVVDALGAKTNLDGSATDPAYVARQIRSSAGNLPIDGIRPQSPTGDATLTFKIYEIFTSTVDNGTAVTTLSLTNQSANVTVTASTDTQVTKIRLYRRGGSITNNWYFVGEFPNSTGAVNDNIPDTSLGQAVQLTNDAPVTSVATLQRPLPYIWGPFATRVLGCGDPDRPEAVYFSNPGNADQWPSPNWIEVSNPGEPLVNGLVYNTRTFAFTNDRMYELIPGVVGGVTFTPYPTPCNRGLVSPWGLAASGKAIYFVAKDGVYQTQGAEEQSLVENDIKLLFPTKDGLGISVNGYDAVDVSRWEDIQLEYHNDELYFTYRGVFTGSRQYLIYDTQKNRWRAASYTPQMCSFYSEKGPPLPNFIAPGTILYGGIDGVLYLSGPFFADQVNTPISCLVRTGAHDQNDPLSQKEYGNVVFDLDPGGANALNPITITPYLNGEALTGSAITVTNGIYGRTQIPLTLQDIFAYNIEFEIVWSTLNRPNQSPPLISPIFYQYDILWRLEPTSLTHWEVRETSHGMPGYHHIRDMYVVVRSTQSITLTLTPDQQTPLTFLISSTGGVKKKLYLPINSNKAKVFHYSFDSVDGSSPFRLYIDESEVRVKPWLTGLGYKVVKPFGGESAMIAGEFGARIIEGQQ